MSQPFHFFVGIDWAWKEHTVCIIHPDGQQLEHVTIAHSGTGLARLRERLGNLPGAPQSVAVAIEVPRGAIVESLLECQFAVFSLNPKQLDRFRDRHTLAGAKDDRRDAFVLADSLRTDGPLFRAARREEPALLLLRELLRTAQDRKQDRQRAQNQLSDLLNRYFPQLLELSPAANEAWLWDLLEETPLPATAAQKPRRHWANLLRKHRIRRFDAATLWQLLQAPALPMAPGAAEAASEHVRLLLPTVRLLDQQVENLAQRLGDLLDQMAEQPENRDAKILLSLPGVGRIVGATILAEASQALAERDYHALRALTGCAPVTRRSGKSKTVVMRRSCHPRLRQALYHWAMTSIQNDARSRQHYDTLRGKGHRHGRALRGVADRLLSVLIAMLRNGTTYDPNWRVRA
jgi:transposase